MHFNTFQYYLCLAADWSVVPSRSQQERPARAADRRDPKRSGARGRSLFTHGGGGNTGAQFRTLFDLLEQRDAARDHPRRMGRIPCSITRLPIARRATTSAHAPQLRHIHSRDTKLDRKLPEKAGDGRRGAAIPMASQLCEKARRGRFPGNELASFRIQRQVASCCKGDFGECSLAKRVDLFAIEAFPNFTMPRQVGKLCSGYPFRAR